MTKSTRTLITKLARFQHKVDAAETAWAEGAALDAGFDAGEFSGPAAARALARECDDLARRYGFATADVAFDAIRLLGCRVH